MQNGKSQRKCFKCGRPGNLADERVSLQELCFKCSKFGHRAVECIAVVVFSVGPSYCPTLCFAFGKPMTDESPGFCGPGDFEIDDSAGLVHTQDINIMASPSDGSPEVSYTNNGLGVR